MNDIQGLDAHSNSSDRRAVFPCHKWHKAPVHHMHHLLIFLLHTCSNITQSLTTLQATLSADFALSSHCQVAASVFSHSKLMIQCFPSCSGKYTSRVFKALVLANVTVITNTNLDFLL